MSPDTVPDARSLTPEELSDKFRRDLDDHVASVEDATKRFHQIGEYEPVAHARRPAGVIPPLERRPPQASMQGADDTLGSQYLIRAASKRGTVARLAISRSPTSRNKDKPRLPKGTGFLIGPSILMTNWHALSEFWAPITVAEFDYVKAKTGPPMSMQVHRLKPEKLFYRYRDLDYAVVYVEPASTSGASLLDRGWNPLLKVNPPEKGDLVNIVQHPQGGPQRIAFRDSGVVRRRGRRVHYRADTRLFSSGSPVWDDRWNLVALHRASVARWTDAHGRILYTENGEVWDRNPMHEGRVEWEANEGVEINAIRDHLWAHVQALRASGDPGKREQARLLEPCFVAASGEVPQPPPPPPPIPPTPPTPTPPDPSPRASMMRAWAALDVRGRR